MALSESPCLVTLKELIPRCPWRTQTPPFPGNLKARYVNVKKPLVKDGVRVFWVQKSIGFENEDEDIEVLRIPFEGLFKFFGEFIINNVRKWIDRLLGQIFSLPKYDGSN